MTYLSEHDWTEVIGAAVDSYLIALQVPPRRTHCPPVPPAAF